MATITRHRQDESGTETAPIPTRTSGFRRREATRREPAVVPGASLAKPPALILGSLLLAAGLYFLYRQHGFRPLSNFPSGGAHTTGNAFLGIFGVNGWAGMGTAVAGGLLLFGAAQHHLAKLMSLIVGAVLLAAAVIALLRHGNVLGLAAANGWTELGWGASGLILLANTRARRLRREVALPTHDAERAERPDVTPADVIESRRTA